MQTSLYKTKNGEFTLYVKELDETYHSRDGAISESQHVFIDNGFQQIAKKFKAINILEVGFGTGLNALLSCIESEEIAVDVSYTAVETEPLDYSLVKQLNYLSHIQASSAPVYFQTMHEVSWEEEHRIHSRFKLKKMQARIQQVNLYKEHFHLIYFDAFAPKKQQELWELSVFEKLYNSMKQQGMLVTYSAAGQLKRNLKQAGFEIINPPGANGKREMTVAIKS